MARKRKFIFPINVLYAKANYLKKKVKQFGVVSILNALHRLLNASFILQVKMQWISADSEMRMFGSSMSLVYKMMFLVFMNSIIKKFLSWRVLVKSRSPIYKLPSAIPRISHCTDFFMH